MSIEKQTAFSPLLPQEQSAGQIFKEIAPTPVNNSTANTINAVAGLVQIGGEQYKKYQNNQELKNVATEFTKNLAAVQQGTLNASDAEVRNSAFMSAALVRRPDLAPELKGMAVTILGNSPTEDLNKQLNHTRQEAQKMQDLVLNDQVSTAAKAGMPIMTPDGKLDTAATAKIGNQLNAIHYKLEQDKAAHAALPSQAEKDAADEKALMSAGEGIFQANLNSSLSQFGQVYDQASGQPRQDQLNILGSSVQAHAIVFNNQLREASNKLGVRAEIADRVMGYYNKPIEELKKAATGELSDAANTARNLKSIQDNYAIPVAKSTPLATGMSTNFGGAAAALVVQQPVQNLQGNLSQEATGIEGAVNTPSAIRLGDSNIQDLENKYNVLTGATKYNNLNESDKPTVLDAAVKVGQATEKGFGLLTPKQQENYAHTVTTVSSAMNDAVPNPDNIKKFADYFNRQSFKDTFDKLAKRNIQPEIVDQVSQERIEYSTKTIAQLVKADPSIKYNPKTDTTNNPTVNSLIGNLNIFSQYNPQLSKQGIHLGDNLSEVKTKLFGVSSNPPSAE